MDFKDERIERELQSYEQEADEYVGNPKKTNPLIKNTWQKVANNKGALSTALSPITLFTEMIRAYQKGEYRQIERKTMLKVVGALIYLVSPIDLIPDFIFGFGLADDIAIITFVAKTVFEELSRFSDWKDEQERLRTQPFQSEDAY
ncbi:YkvA family protein [Exiguobacterium flavidum]|uniref:YkvA family protein n=1 Tax=Exiguobacterium flavidum TaxID=2184695 RepID=UPI000DF7B290|nr:YkvA family protein [Exiguobacterium flavidum]